eukprot:727957-Pyramimonas_sp.AAC.1
MVTEMTSAGSVLQGHSLRRKRRPFVRPTTLGTAVEAAEVEAMEDANKEVRANLSSSQPAT